MDEYPPFDPTRTTLPEPYLIALGRVTYIWGGLESVVELAITKLMALDPFDPKSAIIVAHLSWPQRMDTLESLVTLLADDYPHLQRFPNVRIMLKKAQDGRNKLAHNKLAYQDDQVVMLQLSSRGKLKTSITPLSVTDIDEVFSDIGNASMELLKLVLNK
jgi:hypothetical protein